MNVKGNEYKDNMVLKIVAILITMLLLLLLLLMMMMMVLVVPLKTLFFMFLAEYFVPYIDTYIDSIVIDSSCKNV